MANSRSNGKLRIRSLITLVEVPLVVYVNDCDDAMNDARQNAHDDNFCMHLKQQTFPHLTQDIIPWSEVADNCNGSVQTIHSDKSSYNIWQLAHEHSSDDNDFSEIGECVESGNKNSYLEK